VRFTLFRGIGVGLMAVALFSSSAAAAAESDGTVVGRITCGADEITPAAHIVVAVEGMHVQTLTDDTGHFTLPDLPTDLPLTIEAISDPQASFTVSRSDLVLEPGETLDIGSIDLAVCGQPAAPQSDEEVLVTDH
jgi:hypothetical protein